MTRGLPKGRQAANDRAPTIEKIRKLVEYPDRRIKPIVYTMVSSGIRLAACNLLQWKHVEPILKEDGEIMLAEILMIHEKIIIRHLLFKFYPFFLW